MPSKGFLEALRGGDSVEIEPGIYARVNPKDRTLETSSGKKLPISEKYRAELFPDEKSKPIIEARDKVRKRVADSPLGEFGHQLTSGGIPGAGKDWYNYFTKSDEDYLSNKAAENYVSQQISEQSPWTSAAATGTNIGLDLFLTRGMSGARAAPLLMGAQAGPRVLEEPMEVAGEMAVGAGLGKIVDVGANYIGKIANRRALSRDVKSQAFATEEANVLGQQAVKDANAAELAQYNTDKFQTTQKNAISLNNYKTELANRKAKIQQDWSDYTQKVNQRDQQIVQLKQNQEALKAQRSVDEFKLNQERATLEHERNMEIFEKKQSYEKAMAQHSGDTAALKKEYEQSLESWKKQKAQIDNEDILRRNQWEAEQRQAEQQFKDQERAWKIEREQIQAQNKAQMVEYEKQAARVPELERQAKQEYSQQVVKAADRIGSQFPKESRIPTDAFGSSNFIKNNIEDTGLIALPAGKKSAKIINSIFPEGELITGNEIGKRYRSLEKFIVDSEPEVSDVLLNFKNHLSDQLPEILADNLALTRLAPKLEKQILSFVDDALNKMVTELPNMRSKAELKGLVSNQIKDFFRFNRMGFRQKLESGQFVDELLSKAINSDDFLLISSQAPMKMKNARGRTQAVDTKPFAGIFKNAERLHQELISRVSDSYAKVAQKYNLESSLAQFDAIQKLGGAPKKTLGQGSYGIFPEMPVPREVAPRPAKSVGAPFEKATYPDRPSTPMLPNTPEKPIMPSPIGPQGTVLPVPGMQMPAPIPKPNDPPMPQYPTLDPLPQKPNPQNFSPTPIPQLPPASGFAESLGDRFEQPLLKGNMTDNLMKLSLLKMLGGPATHLAEGVAGLGYMGMKGLTNPNIPGAAMARQGGLAAVDAMAQKYYSYHNGILDDPAERRSLTREIEDDQELSLEDKAVLQSKVNRGKSIYSSTL